MNRQKLALFVLLILFAVALVWSFYSTPRQKTVASLKYAPGQKAEVIRKTTIPPKTAAGIKNSIPGDERVLRLDILNSSAVSFKGYKRNIFKPIFIDELTLMKQKAADMKTVVVPPKTVKPVISQPQVAQPEPPRTALARFTFLGFLQKDGHKTIFLSKDKEIILVKSGERFSGGRYEVRSLTDQALTIVVTENGEEIVVPLLENKPLLAASHT